LAPPDGKSCQRMSSISAATSAPLANDRMHDDGWLVVIAASAGGIQAVGEVLRALPSDLNAAVVVVQHRTPHKKSLLEQILARSARMPVLTAVEGQQIEPGHVYVARPDLHLTIGGDHRFAYFDGTRI